MCYNKDRKGKAIEKDIDVTSELDIDNEVKQLTKQYRLLN